MWGVASVMDALSIPARPSTRSSLDMDITGPSSQTPTEMTFDISRVSSTPMTPNTCLPILSTSDQFSAPEPYPHWSPQVPTDPLRPNPLVNALHFAPYRCLDVPCALPESQFRWHVAASTSQEAASTPSVSVPDSEPRLDFHPNFAWACPVRPEIFTTSHIAPNHETLNPNAETAGLRMSQPTSVVRREKRHNRVADGHQLDAFRPYAIPPHPPNHIDAPITCHRVEQSPPRTEVAENPVSTAPDWRLTLDTYEWLFAVMYPKRRPDKKKPTPSGQCQLCDSTCKRAGILQQHVTILHRQRLARKYLAGQPYNLQIALAFVVAQVLCSVVVNPQMDAVHQESQAFLAALKNNPAGLDPLMPDAFPSLRQRLDDFSKLESWVGVQCRHCGMWATRPVALEEHTAVCTGTRQTAESSGLTSGSTETLRLTAGGLAARPNRGGILER